MKTVIFITLAMLSIHHAHGATNTVANIQYLVLAPPRGTSRTAVELVYGTPDFVITNEPKYASKGLVPLKDWRAVDPPRYEYNLLPKVAKLLVVYTSNSVTSACLWQQWNSCPGRPIGVSPEMMRKYQEEDENSLRQQVANRQVIRDKYLTKLAEAPWNKRTAKQIFAVASLNKQINEFNERRMPDMGVTPIDARVSRVAYDPKLDNVTAFDAKGERFFVLTRESSGRFKGILKQPYHQLVGSEPDSSHSWGHLLADFYLEKDCLADEIAP